MHQINLNDRAYQEAERKATEAGFTSVEEYIADLLLGDFENLDRFFTPERLAHIDRAAKSIADGRGLSLEQVDIELAKRREEWLRQNK